ncbi:nuclear RNA export factor 1-like [Temnothorax curvispinosus]|uniref:Nuclear RNA export factor 1-like n=1 Tax=Temnothorax curvispinosus TaxID=300111 RepID=A0A6J1PLH9_9HYME|nr:nuclear RNA export factor 1-like [Temnothorax curvispinosus]
MTCFPCRSLSEGQIGKLRLDKGAELSELRRAFLFSSDSSRELLDTPRKMPRNKSNKWGGRNNRGGNEDKGYFGHDDRTGRNNVGRDDGPPHIGPIKHQHRVSFKSTFRPKEFFKPGQRDMRKLALTSLDEDIPMTGSSNNNTRQVIINQRDGRVGGDRAWRKISRGRNSPMPNFKGGQAGPRMRPLLMESNWYKITIPYAHKYEKDYIINTLLNYMAPEVFIPIMYKLMGKEASFFVDDHKTVNALLNCDRKITMSDGYKLQVKAKADSPIYEIDDKLKERLKQAMVKRYVQETNALDLSKFHLDPDLYSDYFCALCYPIMFMTVMDIVGEHIPNLEALNLEGNKLQNIERLGVLSKKFSKLKILYVGDNKIRDIHQLDAIKDLKLDELKLIGNPVCNKYRTRQNEYVSDVRRRFPKLLRLDGIELPRPIVFDVVDEAAKILPSQRMFVGDAKIQDIASQFLQQYFTIFDSENRQPLLDAYDEHACFSMTITTSHNNKLNGYLMENRNLFRINDTNRRHKLLKQGRLPVVSFVSEMPRTRHLLNTFTMDVSLATQAMMFITITGYFQELDNKDEPIRYFNRTFIIVPEGEGYCIRNEQLHISQPPEAQLKQLHQQLNQLNNQQPQPTTSALETVGVAKPVPTDLSNDIKQQMTLTLSQQTNMNLEWSLKCLQETQWNYDNALSAFQEFYKRGQVPSEAFTK